MEPLSGPDHELIARISHAAHVANLLDGERATIARRRLVALDLTARLGALASLPDAPGLDELVALEHLDLSRNQLTSLDLSRTPPRLATVRARKNRLRELDLSGASGLETLDVRDNVLRSLDLTPLVRADEILISGNPLEEVSVIDLTLVVHPKLRKAAKRMLVRAATTHELHYACDTHNWDDSPELLEWAVRQPQCDPATALLVFFRASPGHFYALRKRDADEARTLGLLRFIEARFARGDFAGASIAYDPARDVGADAVVARSVPRAMNMRARPVKGSPRYPFPRVAG